MLGLWFAQDAWSFPSKNIVFCLLPGYCLFLRRSWPCRKKQKRRKAVEKKFIGKWSEWFLSCKTSKMTKKRKMQFWLFNWESSMFRPVYTSAHVFAWIARGTLWGFSLICTTLGSARRWKRNDTVFKNVCWGAVSHKRPVGYIFIAIKRQKLEIGHVWWATQLVTLLMVTWRQRNIFIDWYHKHVRYKLRPMYTTQYLKTSS